MMNNFRPLDWLVNTQYSEESRSKTEALALAINANDISTAQEQITEVFGWTIIPPDAGFELHADDTLTYPGMPPLQPIAMAHHGLEKILLFPAGFIVIAQLNGNFALTKIIQ